MHFGEYELFPSLISLSPLPSTHRGIFQHSAVRSSIQCYLNFNLVKGRSLGFASTIYNSLSVSKEYLALGDGPPRFVQDCTCPALLRILLAKPSLRIRDYHPLWWSFPAHFCSLPPVTCCSPTTPLLPKQEWFGLVPVRSPLLRESLNCSLLLWVLRCFSSPRLLMHSM